MYYWQLFLIQYYMNLNEVKLNTECMVKSVLINDYKTKIRLMELGLISGQKITVKHKSMLKNTLLIAFNNACFTIKNNLAGSVEVEYV